MTWRQSFLAQKNFLRITSLTHTHITNANTNTRTYTHSLSLLGISWTWRYFLGRYVALSFVQKVLLQLKRIGHFLFSAFQLQEAEDFDCE